ncbi:MFS general substrate transporter [Hysterangium stoloniferum]|nr:MFS general substrate transporter [Hysterangium stoloniferum]
MRFAGEDGARIGVLKIGSWTVNSLSLADVSKDHLDPRIENPVDKSPILRHAIQDAIHAEKDHHASTPAVAVDASNTIYVEFTEGDPRNPMNFSRPRKWLITIVACAMTTITATTASSVSLGFPSMMRDLNTTPELASVTLRHVILSISPLLRSTHHPYAFLIGKKYFYSGSAGATMVGGVVADIWAPYEYVSLFPIKRQGGVILTREARELRKKTGDSRHRARIEDENPPLKQLIYISCTRPLYLLFTEPVVASVSLWIGLASIALIFRTLHHFNSAQVGLAFSPTWQHVKKRGPEARLYAAMAAAVLFPIGCFIYAWTAQPSIRSWVGPMFGIFIFITALFSMYLAVFSYLADAYGIYASSALAGQSLCRNIMGAAFPLFTNQA